MRWVNEFLLYLAGRGDEVRDPLLYDPANPPLRFITVGKDIAQTNRWHVTISVEGRLYHSARKYHFDAIDAAVQAEIRRLREFGINVEYQPEERPVL